MKVVQQLRVLWHPVRPRLECLVVCLLSHLLMGSADGGLLCVGRSLLAFVALRELLSSRCLSGEGRESGAGMLQ